MPFKSQAQRRYLYARKPDVAEEFADKTPKSVMKKLPEYVKDKDGFQKLSKKYRRKSNG